MKINAKIMVPAIAAVSGFVVGASVSAFSLGRCSVSSFDDGYECGLRSAIIDLERELENDSFGVVDGENLISRWEAENWKIIKRNK